MDNNNNKREKIIIFILGAVLIIAVLSIIAIFSSAIMRLLGFEYESVGGFILYFIIASIVSYPMNLVAGAFPKALLNLDRITREMARLYVCAVRYYHYIFRLLYRRLFHALCICKYDFADCFGSGVCTLWISDVKKKES